MSKINIGISIDLQKLIRSKLLIQAGSDGGKSQTARKIIEESFGKVQIIIMDPEDEYASLREKYDFVLIGEGGEIPINTKYAEVIAHKLLETGMSAIINLYEMKPDDRILFVRDFINAMTYAPKKLWHACMVVIDEFQLFAPEDGRAASTPAMREAGTRWRKRGFFFVLMTQRISMVDKTVVGQCHNRLIGFNSLDIDVERAGKELGFKKERWNELKHLLSGEFYAYGPAISREVVKFRAKNVITKHPKSGEIMKTKPPTPDAIKKILNKLEDIPQEAEQELKTKQDLEKKVRAQAVEIKELKSGTISQDILNAKVTEIKSKAAGDAEKILASRINAAKAEFNKQYMHDIQILKNEIKHRDNEIKRIWGYLQEIPERISKIGLQEFKELPEFAIADVKYSQIIPENIPVVSKQVPNISKPVINITKPERNVTDNENNNTVIKQGAFKMLQAVAMYHPEQVKKNRVKTISGLSAGGFRNYLGDLKRAGYITIAGDLISITSEGIEYVGNIPPLPNNADLLGMWCGNFKKGHGDMLRYLFNNYPEWVTKESIIEATGLSTGGFRNYLGDLKRNDLITVEENNVRLSEEFFV